MAKLTIEIEAPAQAFGEYADDLGYTPELPNEYGNGTSPNPQNRAEFLAEKIKTIVAVALAERKAEAKRKEKQQEATQENETFRKQVESAITVTTS